VSCLLSRGLDAEMHDGQTLDEVLDQIDMRDADSRADDYQMPEEIRRRLR
jgi:hypothetical protein